MIVQATRVGRKGGVHYLAAHLLDKVDDNDRIEVLAGDRAALHDAQALADVKRCRYSVRHLSISPQREMSPAQLAEFIRAIDAEFGIGSERPRLLVRHLKKGRSHFHFAVAEVDPWTFRVLDCRNDFRRLEDLARRYEADHGELVQASRAERRADKAEGFSDVARRRAERVSPDFDRSRLKTAFAQGTAAFLAELPTQGLRLADGDKGPILVDTAGAFVAAANRAAGVRKHEFLKFIEGLQNEQLIGSQTPTPEHTGDGGTQHNAAPAAPVVARKPGGARSDRRINGIAPPYPRHAAPSSRGSEIYHRQARSSVPALTGLRREDIMLARLNKELDDLLRRALELANWMRSIVESESVRLARQINDARQKRKSFPPATPTVPSAPTYDYRRRMTP